jgi:nitrite reductase/ring-hydroxylating ferredoxin subunit
MAEELHPGPTRRRLAGVVVTLGLLCAGGLAVPLLGSLLHPLRRRTITGGTGEWLAVGRTGDFPPGRPRRCDLRTTRRDAWTRFGRARLGAVWVTAGAGGAFTALSAACPHLGCGVARRRRGGGFACPCHDSEFAADGAVLGGPSPRAMDPLDVEVRGGVVFVRYLRFKPGTSRRIPA